MRKERIPLARTVGARRSDVNGRSDTVVHSDGTRRTFVEEGVDERGEYLLVRSVVPREGALPGPHWHPAVEQTFAVEEGKVRFRVDGRDLVLGPGGSVTVRPGQVHEFSNTGEDRVVVVEEDRPPGRHREMFELIHRLDLAGKLNERGIPTNPLLLGLLWERIDGYIAGPPVFFQKLVFGGLARLARLVGYEDRWASRPGEEPVRVCSAGNATP